MSCQGKQSRCAIVWYKVVLHEGAANNNKMFWTWSHRLFSLLIVVVHFEPFKAKRRRNICTPHWAAVTPSHTHSSHCWWPIRRLKAHGAAFEHLTDLPVHSHLLRLLWGDTEMFLSQMRAVISVPVCTEARAQSDVPETPHLRGALEASSREGPPQPPPAAAPRWPSSSQTSEEARVRSCEPSAERGGP